MKEYVYKFSIIVGIAILILAIPMSFYFPVSMSFENNLIENIQVVVLIISGIYNITLIHDETKIFNIWCSLLSMLLAFRELSWGRVFYQVGFEATAHWNKY